jgi:hypothetical protein
MREYWRAWHHLNKNNNSLFMDNYFKKYRQCDQVVKEAPDQARAMVEAREKKKHGNT